MPKMLQYTPEFKDQAVRFVFDEIGPDESRKEACRRLAPKVNVKEGVSLAGFAESSCTVGEPFFDRGAGGGGGRYWPALPAFAVSNMDDRSFTIGIDRSDGEGAQFTDS